MLNPQFQIGGYVSTYYAYCDDGSEPSGFVQFPMLAPRNDQFSLNMALLTMQYKSPNMRSNITLHYGNVPAGSWPATFNLIREANAGFRIHRKLWFYARFSEPTALNAEWRLLESGHLIFRQKNRVLNQRNEFIVCLDLWF